MLIIGIAGGTGSGKTTVVRKIIESLPAGEVVLLPQDSYYKDSSHVPAAERQRINFDHPDAFDWPLLRAQVSALRRGESIEQPTYDYITSSRQARTLHIEPREVVIIEGIMALYDPGLRAMMDLKVYVDTHPKAQYHEGSSGIWQIPCHIALPCATQNELDGASAKALIANGCFAVAEGANMPSTPEAIEAFHQAGVLFAPAKAANAGGVAVSALEMSQNSMRLYWSFEEVDNHLKKIMGTLYGNVISAAQEYGMPHDLVAGANIAGFLKVANSMLAYGVV